MNYYPVIVPTLNRYEHFRRLVESLAKNTHADKTELVIGLDYPPSEKYVEGYEKIKSYLPTITGFKKVTIFTTDKNLGASINGKRLVEYVRNAGYNAYIFTEDDNEFSPCFLDYINKGLAKYKNDDHVLCVCGYSPFDYKNTDNVYFARAMSAWGYGMTFEKRSQIQPYHTIESMKSILKDWSTSMRLFRLRPNSLSAMITQIKRGVVYGDSCYLRYCLLNNVYCVFPSNSLVRNWGHDGSGLHCKVDKERFVTRSISEETTFTFPDVPIMEKREIRELLVKDYTKHWYGNFAIFLRYVIWRLIGKDIFVAIDKCFWK